MFGYVIPNESLLNDEDKKIYRSFYCGLCRAIGERYGTLPRLTLNYELTFLALVLSAADGEEAPENARGCLLHPLGKKPFVSGAHLAYAADMTILLSAAKAEDDRRDDHSPGAVCTLSMLKKARKKAGELHPAEQEAITSCLARLTGYENANEMNPDLPASVFGELLAQVFAGGVADPEKKPGFASFGFLLGKFLYLMDAAVDLRSDLKHRRYNPLSAYPSSLRLEMLELLMGDVEKSYESLSIPAYPELIRNILLSGIWTRYNMKQPDRKGGGKNDQ